MNVRAALTGQKDNDKRPLYFGGLLFLKHRQYGSILGGLMFIKIFEYAGPY